MIKGQPEGHTLSESRDYLGSKSGCELGLKWMLRKLDFVSSGVKGQLKEGSEASH